MYGENTKSIAIPIYTVLPHCVIGRNNNIIWRIARKRIKIAIGIYKFGGYGTIATPPGVYAVGAILADLILAL